MGTDETAEDLAAPSYALTVNIVSGPGNLLGNAGTADFYVSAANGGGAGVTVDRSVTLLRNGPWEQFHLIALDGAGHWAIQTYNGHYLSAHGGGGGVVAADRTAIGPWETFYVPNSLTPNWTFQTANGHWLSAQGNGCETHCVLDAHASVPSTWEHFIVTAVVDHQVLKEIYGQGWEMYQGFQVFGPTVSTGNGSVKYHELTLQTDGNLVLYRHDVDSHGSDRMTATWAPPHNACVHKGTVLRFGEQGNGIGGFDLSVVNADGSTCFNVNKGAYGTSYLDVQADGNLVIYTNGGIGPVAQWATGTNGR